MSTEIKSIYASLYEDRGLLIERIGRHVNVLADQPHSGRTVTIPDLLAAVATECDAIVIPRADLFPVVVMRAGEYSAGQLITAPTSAADARQAAREWLSIAEYLDAHPPVDPQVEALARLLWEYAQNPSGPGDTFDETNDAERNRHRNRAARLVARGRPSGPAMSTDVTFEPGCTISPGFAVCGPGGVVVQNRGKCWGLCAKDDARLLVRWPNSAYYGPGVRCECGDHWCPSEDWLYPRPFERGWRVKAQGRFEADWPTALPEGTAARYGSDPDSDDFAWLYAVRLPDGTEVLR